MIDMARFRDDNDNKYYSRRVVLIKNHWCGCHLVTLFGSDWFGLVWFDLDDDNNNTNDTRRIITRTTLLSHLRDLRFTRLIRCDREEDKMSERARG